MPRAEWVSSERDPFALFAAWRAFAHAGAVRRFPDAVCVATVDEWGAPAARTVDLKAFSPNGFVFCTHLLSPKAKHLAANANAALTFWWDHVGRQVRVVGRAERIPDAEADDLFRTRSRDAQITSWCHVPSRERRTPEMELECVHSMRQRYEGSEVPRPPDWGGFRVTPVRMEFLTFQEDRMHERVLFVRRDGAWVRSWLQP